MKVIGVVALLALLLPLAVPLVDAEANGVHVTVRYHHNSKRRNEITVPQPIDRSKHKLYHVTGNKASFDEFLSPAMQKQLGLDLWRIRNVGGGSLVADIAATADGIAQLTKRFTTTNKHPVKGADHHTAPYKLQVKQDTSGGWVSLEDRIEQDRKEVQSCLYATKGYATTLTTPSNEPIADSAFFDCFRPHDQVFEFFDALTEANGDILTKIHNVSTTFEGRSIHAYKISSTTTSTTTTAASRHLRAQPAKQIIYTQSLMHAREWQAGASHFYAMASLMDALKRGDKATIALFDTYDWIFTPIVNIDGYKYSWEVDRYWRTNRHPSNGFQGVDLNRNFPPEEYWNVDPNDVNEETNPGEAPLSEPETRGIYDFVMSLPQISGIVDIHAFGGMVLRPFSDAHGEPEEPYGSAMKRLGDAVRDALTPKEKNAGFYVSQTGGELYAAYGCMDDGFFREFEFAVPALTIEVQGDDFIAPQKTIRTAGGHISHGLRQFAKEVTTYRKMIKTLEE